MSLAWRWWLHGSIVLPPASCVAGVLEASVFHAAQPVEELIAMARGGSRGQDVGARGVLFLLRSGAGRPSPHLIRGEEASPRTRIGGDVRAVMGGGGRRGPAKGSEA